MYIGTRRAARNLVAGLALAVGLTAGVAPAQAQLFGFWGTRSFSYGGSSGLSLGELQGIVSDEGMRLVRPPVRNGNVYVADAIDARGWQHRLIIDADSGNIVQSFGRGQVPTQRYEASPAPAVPPARIARAAPNEPYVIPGIGGENSSIVRPVAKPKPKAAKKPPVIARSPVESRPLEIPPAKMFVPQPAPVIVPAKPSDPPAAVLDRPQPAPLAEAPVAAARPAPPAVNDVPVAPLYEVPAKPEPGRVNDVPVAPLD